MSRLISDAYQKLNYDLHRDQPGYGAGGHENVHLAANFVRATGARSLLDYGCGKGTFKIALEKVLPELDVREYDPSVARKSKMPDAAQIVTCLDVMEHIEPNHLDDVIKHIASLAMQAVFMTISTVPAMKTLADGRNAHLIVQPHLWWQERLGRSFTVLHEDLSLANGFLYVGKPVAQKLGRARRA